MIRKSMAKLYFSYSTMNAGKSTILLQASYNYRERGMRTVLYTSSLDDRIKKGEIHSRIGISQAAETFNKNSNLYDEIIAEHKNEPIACVLIDEAQFLSENQVWQLARIGDELKIPVMCFGLRTDFQGKLFEGSKALLAIADTLREIRTICWCGSKANMVVRIDGDGNVLEEGEQVVIGGEEKYISLCRKHWRSKQLS